jgi:hypothetical protein
VYFTSCHFILVSRHSTFVSFVPFVPFVPSW